MEEPWEQAKIVTEVAEFVHTHRMLVDYILRALNNTVNNKHVVNE